MYDKINSQINNSAFVGSGQTSGLSPEKLLNGMNRKGD